MGFGEVGFIDSGEDVRDTKFEGMGRGQLRRVRLAEFTEFGKLEWYGGLGCSDQMCFQQRLWAKEATSATLWK